MEGSDVFCMEGLRKFSTRTASVPRHTWIQAIKVIILAKLLSPCG